jgi:hypothetical protein
MTTTEARALAADILTGKYDAFGPWLNTYNFQPSEWRDAAQYLVDTDDCDELLYMMAVEQATERDGFSGDDDCDDMFWRDSSYAIDRGMGEAA